MAIDEHPLAMDASTFLRTLADIVDDMNGKLYDRGWEGKINGYYPSSWSGFAYLIAERLDLGTDMDMQEAEEKM